MKQWYCTVCGYIHTGEEPPENCPVCGSPKSVFIEYKPEGEKAEETTTEEEVTSSSMADNQEEVKTDVVVVGSGAAALSAAVTAIQEGKKVIVLEKAGTLGGTTRRSGGRYWIPNNYLQKEAGIVDRKKDAVAYMARASFPVKYNSELPQYGLSDYEYSMLENYYDKSTEMLDYFRENGVFESVADKNWKNDYHVDYLENLPENNGVVGRSLYAKTEKGDAGAGGKDLIDLFLAWLQKHDADIRVDYEVTDLITYDNGDVAGVIAKHEGVITRFYAQDGVIFGSGGFSHNPELLERFHKDPLIGGCAVPTNTGDIISITEPLGVALGNMGNAYRLQSMYEVHMANPGGASSTFYFIGDSFLEVNKYGKRVVNEKRNYNDRAKIHYVWDPVKGEYPNQFLFFICDQRALDYWGGFPPYPAGDPADSPHVISGNTISELAGNLSSRLETLKASTGHFRLENDFADNLQKTIANFNTYARAGVDQEFHRGETTYETEYAALPPFAPDVAWPEMPNNSMHPIAETGPYYAIILAPGSLDTNGGPMINQNGQVLRQGGTPIGGLYGAGNCIASPGMGAYWGAGATIGPAMTYGYLAAKHTSKNETK